MASRSSRATSLSFHHTAELEARVLIWAYTRDAQLTCGFLEDSGFLCQTCTTWEEFATEWRKGAGAVVVAGELLTAGTWSRIESILGSEPPWSDPPIVIVGADSDAEQLDAMASAGNLSVLQRPLSLKTLRSTVRAALRARRRQYQVRDLLREKDEAEQRKDEFLAMLAHELRNPLAPLRTGLQLLRLEPRPEVVTRTHTMMDRQITNLTRLVDDLLDVSRITRRKIALKRQPLDLRESIRQTVDAMQPLAREKGVQLSAHLPATPIRVNGDAVRLEQMIGNLVSNSIKFTPPSGVIRVTAETEGAFAVLRVSDTGIGIPQEQLHRVFDLFAQTPRALDRSQGGLGIGLTVVKLLAELHEGSADISSGDGTGTEVVIRLPALEDVELHGDRGKEKSSADSPRASRRILLIEDNYDVAEMLATYLEHVGHQVIVTHDGHAGLEAALRHRPDVLICDIGLPGLNGYEIATRLRDRWHQASCVMIAMTGYGDTADLEKTRTAGFTHHLTKPADPIRVAELIAEVGDAGDAGRSA